MENNTTTMNNNTMKHYQVLCYFCTIKEKDFSKLYKYGFDHSESLTILSDSNFEWESDNEYNLIFQNDEEAIKWFHENFKSSLDNDPAWVRNNIVTGKEYELYECILDEDGDIEDTIHLETSEFTPLEMKFTVTLFDSYETKTSLDLNELVNWVMEKNPKGFRLESDFDGDIFDTEINDISDFTELRRKSYITKETCVKAGKALVDILY